MHTRGWERNPLKIQMSLISMISGGLEVRCVYIRLLFLPELTTHCCILYSHHEERNQIYGRPFCILELTCITSGYVVLIHSLLRQKARFKQCLSQEKPSKLCSKCLQHTNRLNGAGSRYGQESQTGGYAFKK